MRVDIWSDVVCPWCYVGKARFEKALAAFPHAGGVEVVYHSFELDPGAVDTGETNIQMLAKKSGMPVAQARQAEDRVAGLAEAEGLGYQPERPIGNTFDLHRVIHLGKAHGVQAELITGIYQAHFAQNRPVFDAGVIVTVAAKAGLAAEDVRKVLDSDAYADAVREDEEQARQLGISGVPFYVVDMAIGVSGAQPAETFETALTQAWDRSEGSTSA
jgi:predicted DsbA family dithiol-disulfide isomerase